MEARISSNSLCSNPLNSGIGNVSLFAERIHACVRRWDGGCLVGAAHLLVKAFGLIVLSLTYDTPFYTNHSPIPTIIIYR
jgi:hypothetical protein